MNIHFATFFFSPCHTLVITAIVKSMILKLKIVQAGFDGWNTNRIFPFKVFEQLESSYLWHPPVTSIIVMFKLSWGSIFWKEIHIKRLLALVHLLWTNCSSCVFTFACDQWLISFKLELRLIGVKWILRQKRLYLENLQLKCFFTENFI